MAVIAVFRAPLLPASETFIRDQALALRRNEALFVGAHRVPGLALPAGRVVVAEPGGVRRRTIRRRLPRFDPEGRVAAACRARGVQLVHAHFGPDGVRALGLVERLGVPLVVSYWGFDATLTDRALRDAGGVLEAYRRRRAELFTRAALILAVSEAIADDIRRQGAPAEKVRVQPTGVAPHTLPPPEDRPPVVLFVGRHVEKKGLGDLVTAMAAVEAQVPGATLQVIGDGPLRAEVEDRARRTLRRAEFLGWLGPEQVAERMRRARVLCVPSRRAANGDSEGLPTVILEAMAAGVPVVATRHSGIPEAVVDGGTGLLADEGDTQALARGLVAVLRDERLARRLGAAGQARARRTFDRERLTALLEDRYDEVLGSGARAVAREERVVRLALPGR